MYKKTSIIRIVRMSFSEETLPKFLILFERYKNDISSQTGCNSVELLADIKAPLVCSTISYWDSEVSLNMYRKSKLFGKVWPETKSLFSKPPEAVSYQPFASL